MVHAKYRTISSSTSQVMLYCCSKSYDISSLKVKFKFFILTFENSNELFFYFFSELISYIFPFHSLCLQPKLISLYLNEWMNEWTKKKQMNVKHKPASKPLNVFFPLHRKCSSQVATCLSSSLCSNVTWSKRFSLTNSYEIALSYLYCVPSCLLHLLYIFSYPSSLSDVLYNSLFLSPLIRMQVTRGQDYYQFSSMWNSQHLE